MTSTSNMSETDSTVTSSHGGTSDNKNLEIEPESTRQGQPSPIAQEVANSSVEESVDNDTRTTEGVKDELTDYLNFKEKGPTKKRKKNEVDDEETLDVLLDVFLRSMYPLNSRMDKTITVGVFKSLNFKPAVLINHCGKTSLLLTVEMWDTFTKYASIIGAYLNNNLTGRKTAIGFDGSDIEIDNIRLRGYQYVRFRDLSKHNKKILLTFEEFQVLSNLIPAVIRYVQQLITYGPVIFDYLNSSVNANPEVPLIYGPIDHSIYNRLPQEVSFHRRSTSFFLKLRRDETTSNDLEKDITHEDEPAENIRT